MILTNITPKEQITLPRAVMKKMGITADSEMVIEVVNDTIVMRKVEIPVQAESENKASNVG